MGDDFPKARQPDQNLAGLWPGQGGGREGQPVGGWEQTGTLEAVMGLRHVCPPCVKLQETSMVSDEQPRFGSTQ